MKKHIRNIFIVLMFVPVVTMAEICPDNPPAVKHYREIYSCQAANVITEGKKYIGDSWECFSLIPVISETVYYVHGKYKGRLPTVNSLLHDADKDFKTRIWMVTDVKCIDKNTVNVFYWSGGNCERCAKIVQYRFSDYGKIKQATLKDGDFGD